MSTDFEQGLKKQQEEAAARFRERAVARRKVIAALARPGGIAEVNSADDLARRFDRLTRYYSGEHLPTSPSHTSLAPPGDVLSTAVERVVASADRDATWMAETIASVADRAGGVQPEVSRPAVAAETQAAVVLEKIINSNDLLGIRYLEAGVAAARAVCRVNIGDALDRVEGYGTACLVSPRLLLTNHHVLPSVDVARVSGAEFNYQDGVDGQPLQPLVLRLDPDAFFLADRERDFALVAVAAEDSILQPFGFNRLIEAQGKAVIGEFVTIVQHAGGGKKQVALRENKIVDELELFLHYEADTEPGSSGSPVFNDQWEIVALHHASVPAPGRQEFGGYLNEGIRASRLLQFLHQQSYSAGAQRLIDQLYSPERVQVCSASQPDVLPAPPSPQRDQAASSLPIPQEAGTVRVYLPLEISVRLGSPTVPAPAGAQFVEQPPHDGGDEGICIDPDYTDREGYAEGFLGAGEASVPLPTLSEAVRQQAAVFPTGSGEDSELRYHHFSVVMNKERGLAFFTAVNIDGRTSVRLKRDPDRWSFDPRIPRKQQTGNTVYTKNDLDRGHLVRRLDPAWGASPAAAKQAADDTYHFTNCTPQHKQFNANRTTWAGLEDYLLDNAANLAFRVSVFTGPVFAPDDDEYRGVRLPRQFWKVAVILKTENRLSATGYLLSQASLLTGIERAEEFSYAAYGTYQVPVQRIEDLTGVVFGKLKQADPLATREAIVAEREVVKLCDILL
jgi:endonuclease G